MLIQKWKKWRLLVYCDNLASETWAGEWIPNTIVWPKKPYNSAMEFKYCFCWNGVSMFKINEYVMKLQTNDAVLQNTQQLVSH